MSTQDADHQRVLGAMAKALRNFGSLPLAGGALAQAWMPVATADGTSRVLQTKGLPYCLVGPGDMLALFRCLSCKYSFSADLKQLQLLGAPGRVFVSGEAETSDNVQQCSTSVYLRVKDAQACRVSSTILLPVFAHPSRSNAVAVLEITQFHNSGASYQTVFEWAKANLQDVGLFAPQQLETRTFEMQSHAMSIKFFSSRDMALGAMFHENSGLPARPAPLSSGVHQSVTECNGREVSATFPSQRQVASSDVLSGEYGQASGEADREEDEMMAAATSQPAEEEQETSRKVPSNKFALTKVDLEKHFGYGLKEAARRLGVCNTTLKRACRRNGIMKWPRRELVKEAKMQEKAEKKSAISRPAAAATNSQGSDPRAGQSGHNEGSQQPQLQFHQNSVAASRGFPSTGHLDSHSREAQRRLRHAVSVNYLPTALPPSDLTTSAPPPSTSNGIATSAALGLGDQQLPSLDRWQGLANATARTANAGARPDKGEELTERQASGPVDRRGSLGFVDSMFTDAEGYELNSVLSDWEQHLSNLRGTADPQAPVATAGESDNLEQSREMKGFPDIPETWEQDTAARSWAF